MAGGILDFQLCILRIEHFHKAVKERAIPFELVALDGNAALGVWHLEKAPKPLADNLSQNVVGIPRDYLIIHASIRLDDLLFHHAPPGRSCQFDLLCGGGGLDGKDSSANLRIAIGIPMVCLGKEITAPIGCGKGKLKIVRFPDIYIQGTNIQRAKFAVRSDCDKLHLGTLLSSKTTMDSRKPPAQ